MGSGGRGELQILTFGAAHERVSSSALPGKRSLTVTPMERQLLAGRATFGLFGEQRGPGLCGLFYLETFFLRFF